MRSAGDSPPPLRLKASSMAERFPSGPSPPFPRKQHNPPGSARSSPGREAAKRTLDGEDRSGIIQGEGKGGTAGRKSIPGHIAERNGIATIRPRMGTVKLSSLAALSPPAAAAISLIPSLRFSATLPQNERILLNLTVPAQLFALRS